MYARKGCFNLIFKFESNFSKYHFWPACQTLDSPAVVLKYLNSNFFLQLKNSLFWVTLPKTTTTKTITFTFTHYQNLSYHFHVLSLSLRCLFFARWQRWCKNINAHRVCVCVRVCVCDCSLIINVGRDLTSWEEIKNS